MNCTGVSSVSVVVDILAEFDGGNDAPQVWKHVNYSINRETKLYSGVIAYDERLRKLES